MNMKTCTKCGIEKPLEDFYADKRAKGGRKSRCQACYKEHRRNRYATDSAVRERKRDLEEARRRGEKLEPLLKPTASERFDEFLMPIPNTGCLIWIGTIDKYGYGQFRTDGRLMLAHRYAYWRHYGVIPKPELHHTCGVRACCEPSHLLAVTKAEHDAIHAAG